MPELPEIRVHAERLTASHAGHILQVFQVLSFTALKTAGVDPLAAVSQPLERVDTRAKTLILRFGATSHLIHLMQGGRVSPDAKLSAKPRNGLARWRFTEGDALLLTEAGKEHKAGVWVVAGDPLLSDELSGLGPDADTVDVAGLTALLNEHSARLHGFLRTQTILAGIGRRLANEICHTARLSPFAMTRKLTPHEIERLHAALQHEVITSIDFERTQDHMVKSAERPAAVHHREGQACPVCHDTVRAIEYSRYTVNYCATCQTGGKVLADNTTSKFLK